MVVAQSKHVLPLFIILVLAFSSSFFLFFFLSFLLSFSPFVFPKCNGRKGGRVEKGREVVTYVHLTAFGLSVVAQALAI